MTGFGWCRSMFRPRPADGRLTGGPWPRSSPSRWSAASNGGRLARHPACCGRTHRRFGQCQSRLRFGTRQPGLIAAFSFDHRLGSRPTCRGMGMLLVCRTGDGPGGKFGGAVSFTGRRSLLRLRHMSGWSPPVAWRSKLGPALHARRISLDHQRGFGPYSGGLRDRDAWRPARSVRINQKCSSLGEGTVTPYGEDLVLPHVDLGWLDPEALPQRTPCVEFAGAWETACERPIAPDRRRVGSGIPRPNRQCRGFTPEHLSAARTARDMNSPVTPARFGTVNRPTGPTSPGGTAPPITPTPLPPLPALSAPRPRRVDHHRRLGFRGDA